uniref:RRM domain-containing protein n=1 Tax=Aureoumbra lagunensis TaxID=44058 RepID=A0A7S3K2I5_9STRA|mmetsp:Transcript_18376/g.23905  ORF Transcript_18376/g.23905 Transcript_18376/m.23905 type:complete len:432 (-) Transcript_18376:139-1434(-)
MSKSMLYDSTRPPSLIEANQFTVFVGDLAPEVTEADLQTLFTEKYVVLSVKIITDGQGQSKGFGFVTFTSAQDRDSAIREMNGKQLKSKIIRVTRSVGGVARSSSRIVCHSRSTDENTCVFVGGLDESVTPEILRHHFALLGDIAYIRIPPGRGCGFVGYIHHKDAVAAISTLQGLKINGYKVRLAWGSMRNSKTSAQQSPQSHTTLLGTGTAFSTRSGTIQPIITHVKKEHKTPYGTLTHEFSFSALPNPEVPWELKQRTRSLPTYDDTFPQCHDDDYLVYNENESKEEGIVPQRLINRRFTFYNQHQPLSAYVAQLRARYASYNHAISVTRIMPPPKKARLDLFSLHSKRTIFPGRITPDEAYSDDLHLAKWNERHIFSAINGLEDILLPPPPLVQPGDAISHTPMATYLRTLASGFSKTVPAFSLPSE